MTSRFDIQGKVALVTGASQGLGEHFARTLAAHGASVALAARSTDKLESLRRDLEGNGHRAAAIALDVTDPQAIEKAMDRVEADLGPLDVLINNAGIAAPAPVLAITETDWDRVLDTDLKGAFLVAQAAARRMAGRGGSIVNVTSVLGQAVMGTLASYAAAKGGLEQVTRTMALELARDGVRVNALAPGYIATEINRDFFATEAGERLKKRIPQRRLGDPTDLDGALLLLASDASRYMTGSTLVVDGGFLLT
ncbi:MAG: SDR family NAD(P)-dependent oxidoreductase [Pseudomonadota bacterium]